MKKDKLWQQIILVPLGMIAVAVFFYKFDPLQLRLRGQSHPLQSAATIQRNAIDPFYVKGFKQLDGQYFIVILDGVSPTDCPCTDLKVRRGKKANCPVVHHREKTEIIDRGRKLGLPEHDFRVWKCEVE